ncbi:MAG TPA: hypothetical protein VK021_09265 [Flavobacteriaceae bacterium]|nr:hypothetical protein [Flavobacteriaceae bacterium]
MKNTLLFCFLFVLVVSCVQESFDDFPNSLKTSKSAKDEIEMKDAMRVKTLTINLTKAEENFHEKILRLSGNEFSHLHQTLSQDELEKFAISFFKRRK